ncbi:MAG TPA: class I SAM-dependent methyltransferase, partial [Microbacteriaceae bacterium]|nr:class I SAM-dependent methyltransferase [Microbacteriaceae bacterium]
KLRAAGHSAELVSAALTQSRLRGRARAKFGDFAERMLFTEAGLEQASRLRVAAVHAARIRSHRGGVVDLGCGIGGDALAFAAAGLSVLAVDADEVTAAFAAVNLAPFPEARVECENAQDSDIPSDWAVWLDPARRTVDRFGQSQRIFDPASYSPSLTWAFELGARHPIGIKLGPAIDRDALPQSLGSHPVETQWVSIDGDVVECALWSGGLARENVRRSALVLDDSGAAELTASDDLPDVELGELGAFIYEPNGAVIRARLMPLVADELGARLISPSIAYLTGDEPKSSRFASGFRVVDVFPADERTLRRELAARDIGQLEIKKRGWDGDPAALRKKLALQGAASATLFMTRIAGRHRAILTERLRSN